MQKHLVVVDRRLWDALSFAAATARREFGGMIIGRRTRTGAVRAALQIPLAHYEADEDQVQYDFDEVAHAREVAHAIYGPDLEPVGAWHNHPWPNRCRKALVPQITEEDIDDMLVGDVELIVVTFPLRRRGAGDPGSPIVLARTVGRGKIRVRLEAWVKTVEKEAERCRVSLR